MLEENWYNDIYCQYNLYCVNNKINTMNMIDTYFGTTT